MTLVNIYDAIDAEYNLKNLRIICIIFEVLLTKSINLPEDSANLVFDS